jgi:hypothetical protein
MELWFVYSADAGSLFVTDISGLNFVVSMFRAILGHKFLDWTQHLLNNNNHTVELNMLGASLLLTDDPENIKAVQDTQVEFNTSFSL